MANTKNMAAKIPLSREQLQLKPGDRIEQTDDAGVVHVRVVGSQPWQLAGTTMWVILLEGVRGCYALHRCRPLGDTAQ